jgi:cell division protein FtsB
VTERIPPARQQAGEPASPAAVAARTIARRRTIVLRSVVAAVVLIGALFVFVFPISAWLDQRGRLNAAEHRLEVLREQGRRLEQQSTRLRSDEEIERIARDRYGMVRPGEQAWAIVPGTTTTTTTTPATTPTTTPRAPTTR